MLKTRTMAASATSAIVVAAMLAAAAPASAQAVSGTNANVSAAAVVDISGSGAAFSVLQGSVATPLGANFGLQADVTLLLTGAAVVSNLAVHLFWRNAQFMVGAVASMSPIGIGIVSLGAEAAVFFGPVTLQGGVGNLWETGSGGSVAMYWGAEVVFYATPDLRIAGGYRVLDVVFDPSFSVGAEFALGSGLSVFSKVTIPQSGGDTLINVGFNYAIGGSGTLINRDRRDQVRPIISAF